MRLSKNKKYKSIALIICYFGDFPWYFKYYLHSCKYNPSIDFYIVTDNEVPTGEVPSNVFIINKTLAEINEVFSERLGFIVNINRPYKLCDFKPAYGFLFPDIIRDYDFWGYGDIDLIFGDIRTFITDEVLGHYDLINVRHDYLVGYFILYRNNKKMIELFMKSNDYEKVFMNNKYYSFDETNFEFIAFANGVPPEQIQSEIESMNHVVKKQQKDNYIRAYFDIHIMEGCQGKFMWQNGKLYYDNKYELLLYHFIHFKKVYKPNSVKKIPKRFRISPTRIYT